MAVWYLDNDDEITDAVARLRTTDGERVVFVVPPGSRIATGRINFKLLAREAEARSLQLAIASPDEQVRALAMSAGVLVAVTPDQAEAALERGDTPPAPDADGVVAAVGAARIAPASDSVAVGGAHGRRGRRLAAITVVVLAFVLVGGVAAWRSLPTAEVTLIPRVEDLGPLSVAVRAAAEVEAIDVEAGLVPAVLLPISLTAEDEYAASGTRSSETRATGEVVFSAQSQAFDQEIAAGTRVLTPAGTAFATTETVVLPRSVAGATEVRAPVEATAAGEAGNVPAKAISVVPSLEGQGIGVSNPEPTDGGHSEAAPLVLPEDYDAAAVDLRNRLAGELAAHLEDPANTPAGLTLYPETATLGSVTISPPASEVVGSALASFALAGRAEANALAVDVTTIDELLRQRLEAAVPAGMAMVAESVAVDVGEGRAAGAAITFDGIASGRAAAVIDRDQLLRQIAGLPVSEAEAILDALGSATVTVWPDFLGGLPEDRQRISLEISEATRE